MQRQVGLVPALRWQVVPPSESPFLIQAERSRIEGRARLIGSRGRAVYGFRVLSGMAVSVVVQASGAGRIRLRTEAGGLAVRSLVRGVQSYRFTVCIPLQPAVQTLQVVVESLRRTQIRIFSVEVAASDRDEDGDGIGDGVERLLGASAGALRPRSATTLRFLAEGESAPRSLQEVVGQVGAGCAPIPFRGESQSLPFACAYLQCASLAGLTRQSDRQLWLRMNPFSEVATAGRRADYMASAIASAMFGEVQGYELPPIPERVPDSMLLEDVSASLSLVQALESLAEQRTVTIDAGVEGMAALFGEMPPAGQGVASEDLMALLAPLVHAGVPVQMIPIQRAGEPNLLRGVRLLMWTPESVKPQRESEVDALAQWVRQGGWLVIVGGTNDLDALAETPWRQGGFASPLHWLLAKCDVAAEIHTEPAPPAPPEAWRELGRHGDQPQQGTLNRRWVEFDLSAYAGQTVYVRFRDSLPETGWGARVRRVRLEADGRTLAAFSPGTPAGPLFLYHEQGSQRNANGERAADGGASFTYRFPLPQAQRITLRVEIAQEWLVELSTTPPYPERVLNPTRPDLPAIPVRRDESLTRYTIEGSEPFYLWQGAPVGVIQRVGRGGLAFLGVSGRAFGNLPRGDEMWRAVLRYLCAQAEIRYRERARILAKRGDWVAVWGTYRITTLRGTYLDVLDPRLPIQSDIPIEPNRAGLFLQVDARLQRAGLLHTNARVVLQHETPRALSYLVQGPEGAHGVARIAIRGLKGQATLTDTLGNPLPVNTQRERETLLVRWNLSPAGQVLTIR